MAIYKRKDAAGHQVDITIDGKRHRKNFEKEGDAKKYEKELIYQSRLGTYLADGMKVSLADLTAMFIERIWERHRQNKRMSYEYAKSMEGRVRNYVIGNSEFVPRPGGPSVIFRDGLGHIKIAALTEAHVEAWLDASAKIATAKSSTRLLRQTLIDIIDVGISKKLVSRNVARDVSVYDVRNASIIYKISPPSELLVQRMLDLAGEMRLPLLFAASTALRAGEQWALRWRHLDISDPKRAIVRVRTAVSRRRVENSNGPKTDKGNRDIPLGQSLCAELADWRDATEYSDDNDLVFPSQQGTFLTHSNMLSRRFRPLVNKALTTLPATMKPQRPVRWHDLRHFGISQWIAAGATPKAVSTWAGHSSIQFTLDRYGHLFPEEGHHDLMDEINARLRDRRKD